MGSNLKKTLPQFILDAKKVHGTRYSYDKFNYITTGTKGLITCKKHGDFNQTPNSHLNGCGCVRCSYEKRASDRFKGYSKFVTQAKNKHGDKYDYGEFKYKGYGVKGVIVCKEHGVFKQTPVAHLMNSGCRPCAMERGGAVRRKKLEVFIAEAKKVHCGMYDYSGVVYVNGHSKVKVRCSIHGDWMAIPSAHLKGNGCPKCGIKTAADSRRRTNSEFVELAVSVHGQRYTYDRVEYVNSNTKVTVGCKTHGHWGVIANDHIAGRGCPRCSRSKGEEYLSRLFTELGVVNIDQFKLPELNVRYRYDFYLPEYNVLIEYQGGQHYRAIDFFGGEEGFRKTLERDAIKRHLAKETGRKLVYLSYLDMAEARGRYPKFRAIVLRKLRFLKQRLPEGSVKFGDNL